MSDLSNSRQDVLPLAFHVTYWNSLGWKDPYSLEAATQRQAAYSARFGDSAYTPEMVVDGRKSFVGSNRAAGEKAIRSAQASDATSVAVSGKRAGGTLSIDVGAGSGSAQVLLVGYDREHITAVGRGENSGRALKEANIVRSVQSIGQWNGATLKLHPEVPAGERAAVLVQAPDGSIIGAARVDYGTP
ncbi:DUF1223 domain-containing protein [Paraburkholderia sp. RG36]|uniref:DUF1223 domain-containing protein n=1 Tax=Paraburkholderia tagetis TaxID=2913261 RepID=A0A9X1RSH7_9BURK|nr:DUF1223 domain-containing protein [Paraburkholderia tagetis]